MMINSNIPSTSTVAKTQKIAQISAYAQAKPTQNVDKLAQIQEKYKDIYTPIPQTYTSQSEQTQQQKIYEAYPNYIPPQKLFAEASRIYTEEFGEKKIELGDPPLTKEQQEKQEAAFKKVFEPYGGSEAYNAMVKDVFEIQKQYPINQWGKDGLDNASELARFYNAGVYEGLESGKSLEEAKQTAGETMYEYMGNSSNKIMLRAMPNPKLGVEGSDLFYDYIYKEKEEYDYARNIDLREFGIDGAWSENDIYKSDTSMINEIYKKLEQFDFMLNNPDLIDKANDKLKPFYQERTQGYETIIQGREVPSAKLALSIFENYNIYDSVDLRV
jgi:hypothetical protein